MFFKPNDFWKKEMETIDEVIDQLEGAKHVRVFLTKTFNSFARYEKGKDAKVVDKFNKPYFLSSEGLEKFLGEEHESVRRIISVTQGGEFSYTRREGLFVKQKLP